MENRSIKGILKLKRGKLFETIPTIDGVYIKQAQFTYHETTNFQRFDVLETAILRLYTSSMKVKNNIVVLLPRKSDNDIDLYLVYTKNRNMFVCAEKPIFNKFFPNKVDNFTVHLGDGNKVSRATSEFNEVLTRLYLIKPQKVFDTNEI